MKSLLFPLIAGLVLVYPVQCTAQQYEKTENREFVLEKQISSSTLAVYNIFGFVHVEGYEGDKVLIRVDETLKADNNSILEKAKNEFKTEIIQNADSIIAFIAGPFDSRPGYRNLRVEIPYRYKLNYSIKVPSDINLKIQTVNDGNIIIENVNGNLSVNNVNGSIDLKNIRGGTFASTVNGNLNVSYLSNPLSDSDYKTINGNITVSYTADLSAEIQFKSMHGDLFTEFSEVETLPPAVKKNTSNSTGGKIYEISNKNRFRFGAGGNHFSFETLNGNVYIKKQF